jgi:hypothetical protein
MLLPFPNDTTIASVTSSVSLRREIHDRNLAFAQKNNLPHFCTFAEAPSIAYSPNGPSHGNFYPVSYKAILANPQWARRLSKAHTHGRSLPTTDHPWHELDCATSSDALLMNVFCSPATLRSYALRTFLGIEHKDLPIFGYCARVPLLNGRGDRTEVDMRIGNSLFESKLTETDFQRAPKIRVHAYRDFADVFERDNLPQGEDEYRGYQLIRNVLAASVLNGLFILIVDARRPDLTDQFYSVIRTIKDADLRCRCRLLLWQELSTLLSRPLQRFLDEKYGIANRRASGTSWTR